MSAKDAHDSSLLPGDDRPTQRIDAQSDDSMRGDVTHPQIAPSSPGYPPPLVQPRLSARPERSQSAARKRQADRGRTSEGARRGVTPPDAYALPGSQAAPVKRPTQRHPPPPSSSGLYFPWWSLVMLVGLVGLLALGVVLVVGQLTEPNVPGNQPARIQVVTAPPTLSQDFTGVGSSQVGPQQTLWPTAIPAVQPSPTSLLPTPVPSPSLPPGQVMIGVRVSVVGVETSGLNIRSAPGYTGSPRFLAGEGDQFVVVDGPQIIDELEWWRVEDPDDANRYGWAARNYLAVVSP